MKKILFLLLTGASIATADAQVITFTDANFKARLLESDIANNVAKDVNNNSLKIDANNDGEIEQSEALAVYRLFYSPPPPLRPGHRSNAQRTTADLPISDVTGLEFFTNLRKLNLSDNAIAVLDLPDLPNLDYLSCSHNNMTELHLPLLPNLLRLDCSQNELSALALSVLPALQILQCDQNNLTTLVPAGLTALRILACYTNSLTSITFGNNPNLAVIDCSLNQLTQLNLMGTAVERLYCSDNPPLASIKIKNGINSTLTYEQPPLPFEPDCFNLSNLPLLETVCCDAGEVAVMEQVLASQPSVAITTDCLPPAIIHFTDSQFKNKLVNDNCVHFEGDADYDGDADLNNDGEIDVEEALAVYTMNLHEGSITDLEGLQYFENLVGLGISNNPLTHFSGFGLANLSSLWLQSNALATVDLSELVGLENIEVVNESFPNIDFSHNTSLFFARFWESGVTTLNFCGTNLHYFDGQNLPNLTYFSSMNGTVTTDGVLPQTPPPLSPIILRDCPMLQTVCYDQGEYAFINWGVALPDVNYVTDCPLDCSMMSIGTFVSADFGLYPNPVSSVLHLDASGTVESVQIMNQLGQVVSTAKQTTVDVSGWAAGIYLIQIRMDGKQSSKKFIKI